MEYMVNKPVLALFLSLLACHAAAQPAPGVGQPLPAWQEGELDIHHINTGRGDALLFVLPDGTTMMEDFSGKTVESAPFSLPTRPDASRPPGEWVARYARDVIPDSAGNRIDYALVSHFHGDHMGAIVQDSPVAPHGGYKLSGITEVAGHLRFGKVIDRGWPDYAYPAPLDTVTVANYRRFLEWQVAHNGLQVEQFQPGRNDQIVLLHDAKKYPGFEIRNLYANGVVWTSEGNGTRRIFPDASALSGKELPDENKLSVAFRLRYGQFDYFSGGDLSSIVEETTFQPPAWLDVEPVVAQAAGPVDVMKANHHGSWDSNGIGFLAALQPRVVVVTSRADGHPAVNTWRRLTSKKIWPGERDIFVTNVSEVTASTTYDISRVARSTQGHVVVRVAPGGDSYRVFVLEDDDEQHRVKAVFGPYASN